MLVPPHDQPEPEFPFQYLAADYFQYMNKTYCVIVDRYFHRPISQSCPSKGPRGTPGTSGGCSLHLVSVRNK